MLPSIVARLLKLLMTELMLLPGPPPVGIGNGRFRVGDGVTADLGDTIDAETDV